MWAEPLPPRSPRRGVAESHVRRDCFRSGLHPDGTIGKPDLRGQGQCGAQRGAGGRSAATLLLIDVTVEGEVAVAEEGSSARVLLAAYPARTRGAATTKWVRDIRLPLLSAWNGCGQEVTRHITGLGQRRVCSLPAPFVPSAPFSFMRRKPVRSWMMANSRAGRAAPPASLRHRTHRG